jgi:hypothetical protein
VLLPVPVITDVLAAILEGKMASSMWHTIRKGTKVLRSVRMIYFSMDQGVLMLWAHGLPIDLFLRKEHTRVNSQKESRSYSTKFK